jgi:hypothetical protein
MKNRKMGNRLTKQAASACDYNFFTSNKGPKIKSAIMAKVVSKEKIISQRDVSDSCALASSGLRGL